MNVRFGNWLATFKSTEDSAAEPIGLQIVGPAFSENRVIAFGREFQRRTNFHKQHPTIEA